MKLNRKQKRLRRKGAAVVELAVCLPVLMLLVLGTIGATSMIYFKQALTLTAYEGARVALVSGATNADVQAQCDLMISDRRLLGAAVTVSPDVESSLKGTILTVTVSAPCSQNGFFTSFFFSGQTFSESVSMMKEN